MGLSSFMKREVKIITQVGVNVIQRLVKMVVLRTPVCIPDLYRLFPRLGGVLVGDLEGDTGDREGIEARRRWWGISEGRILQSAPEQVINIQRSAFVWQLNIFVISQQNSKKRNSLEVSSSFLISVSACSEGSRKLVTGEKNRTGVCQMKYSLAAPKWLDWVFSSHTPADSVANPGTAHNGLDWVLC